MICVIVGQVKSLNVVTENNFMKTKNILEQDTLFYISSGNIKNNIKIKKQGEVYTPSFIVDNILNIAGYKGSNILKKKIIDNSSGDGAFLVEIVKRYIEEYKKKFNKIDKKLLVELSEYIYGIEIDEMGYKKSIDNLNNVLKEFNIFKKINWKIKLANTLEVNGYDKKMDFVVGNPPYVRIHNLNGNYNNVKKYKFAQDGMTDLYLVFFEIGLKMLKSDGKMCLITPSSFLNSKAGFELRKYIKNEKKMSEIVDLEHFQPFYGITTYTVITLFENDKKNSFVKYYKYNFKKKEKKDLKKINYDLLFIENKIFLANNNDLKKIKNIIENDKKIVDVKNAFATLSDNFFIKKNFEFSEFVIDIYKASTGEKKRCLFPYDKNGEPLSIEKIKKNKKVYNYFLNSKSELKKRSIKCEEEWFLFGRSQGLKDIKKDKIFINTIIKNKDSLKIKKIKKNTGVYSGLYILTKISFEKIEKVLRSDDFVDYVKNLKKYKSGGYYTFSSLELKQYLNYKLN